MFFVWGIEKMSIQQIFVMIKTSHNLRIFFTNKENFIGKKCPYIME